MNKEEICTCECHQIGTCIIHCFPCCELCYEKYIADGKIDMNLYQQSRQRVLGEEANAHQRHSKK